jgi:hypothetical protein
MAITDHREQSERQFSWRRPLVVRREAVIDGPVTTLPGFFWRKEDVKRTLIVKRTPSFSKNVPSTKTTAAGKERKHSGRNRIRTKKSSCGARQALSSKVFSKGTSRERSLWKRRRSAADTPWPVCRFSTRSPGPDHTYSRSQSAFQKGAQGDRRVDGLEASSRRAAASPSPFRHSIQDSGAER